MVGRVNVRVSLSVVCDVWGGGNGGGVKRRKKQPGRRAQDAPLLPSGSPRVLWQVAPCLAAPEAGTEGGPGSGPSARPGRAAQGKLGPSSPPHLPSPAGGGTTRAAGRRAQTRASGGILGLSHSSSSRSIPCSSTVAPSNSGPSRHPAPSFLPACRPSALNLGSWASR